MAIHFLTAYSNLLLQEFNKRIEQKETTGKIITWERSADLEYYTHKAEEWTKKAWFKPLVSDGKLSFFMIKSKGLAISVVVYGYYHGHLAETFLNHFDKDFIEIRTSALLTMGDVA